MIKFVLKNVNKVGLGAQFLFIFHLLQSASPFQRACALAFQEWKDNSARFRTIENKTLKTSRKNGIEKLLFKTIDCDLSSP